MPKPAYYRALDRLPRTTAPAALLHMHYGGTAAIDAVATLLRLRAHPPDRPFYLLDVGSGAGAPARYLANTFPNVHIDCIECDARRHATASALTAREPAHVRRRVRHVCDDVLHFLRTPAARATTVTKRRRRTSTPPTPHTYHGVLCMMTLLHLPLKHVCATLYAARQRLRTGGRIVVEDFSRVAGTSASVRRHTRGELCALFGLCDKATAERTHTQWLAAVRRVTGLRVHTDDDVTYACKAFVDTRVAAGRASDVPVALWRVYKRVAEVFAHGGLGVWRVVLVRGC